MILSVKFWAFPDGIVHLPFRKGKPTTGNYRGANLIAQIKKEVQFSMKANSPVRTFTSFSQVSGLLSSTELSPDFLASVWGF